MREFEAAFPDVPGNLVNWGKVRWKGQRVGKKNEGNVRIQFRTGNSLDTHIYARELGPGLTDIRDDDGKLIGGNTVRADHDEVIELVEALADGALDDVVELAGAFEWRLEAHDVRPAVRPVPELAACSVVAPLARELVHLLLLHLAVRHLAQGSRRNASGDAAGLELRSSSG